MTPDQIEAERVRFEAWWYGVWNGGIPSPPLYRDDDGHYRPGPALMAWQGWLARAELAHERQAAEDLMQRQESQRVGMAEKHERGE